ncbi:MAG: DUF488 domain-containing protein [Burkholderiales bacterium]|nr:DUF488 domain-containing protein [Burkholderiales bacterium]
MASLTPTIYTIGYEGLDIERFLSLLQAHGIETVVDIRELPLSRKRGFSKNVLSDTLGFCGLNYVHIPELGCPKSIRTRYRTDGNWSTYKVAFSQYLQTQSDAIADLSTIAAITNCALLCFEADFNFCHRSIVADAVNKLSGTPVCHISASAIKTTGFADLALAAA